ncbi:3-hydroxyacyl-ACP dehydratase FabZ [Anaeromyxobacter dehalogenans]|uniref:3-hydroxyacyl-[acyl-carrier-protein] dehydratase FabZ n=1 Tax=Anaeromyxobacter dehalogenans (strain 2CP-C) TaxID=290397 RepID=FABZ_ANADE|nr:3-hydroxyacyl-ACP dehydratase FabZ [Anaeromyxobacter dehalogenans]Q2IPX8.1 RecName: Full=3-hydroxyacyl-[acyl-carrier-protein] dehydratase FabZ; AltName: Full=(3R)-hydroxymyristoyl-[acyl-carrier-protein] dehydratase; Short=(3R)-hydroxymyristoyl-ACP dehydrase; AltName: Full=Beta-hydroxyacyl-ACP dehydratase [Anaeromyxobacter dehalogenans 2CP-C]ABC80859.1 3-hydroxyacyl-[acyl-carrier-protein] dehydratase [Anaeromyxobacter dehalogenans 2CP-C]
MSESAERKSILDVVGIQELLPHRPPFLLVDRVVEFEAHRRLVALKGVTMNEPFFQGHFPAQPVMPGVLILEALAQAAALLATMSLKPDEVKDKITYLMGIDGARFRRPVVPGDRLELEVEVTKQKGAVWKQTGVARVDGQVVAEAEFMAMLADRER